MNNLAYSCLGCNNIKAIQIEGADPLTGETASLYHPRRDNWAAHFSWSVDGTQIVGRTPTGRATVSTLELNRIGAVNTRRAMIAFAEPPQSNLEENET